MKKKKDKNKREKGENLTTSGCLSVTFQPGKDNDGGNSDTFTFTITTPGGQSIMVDGEEKEKLSFTITGGWELDDFFKEIRAIHILPF